MDHPTDNLVRSYAAPDAAEVRDDAGDGRTLHGYFAVFNKWTEINSSHEGRFLERVAVGAFDRSLKERGDRIKVLYDHGFDPQLGKRPLGTWTSDRDDRGQWYDVRLSDATFNDDFIIPTARAGLLGSSFRFSVPDGGDAWETPMRATKWNPDRLQERTLLDADVFEFGPVPFPQYVEATAGMRSATDDFFDRLVSDPVALARFAARLSDANLEALLAVLPAVGRSVEHTPEPEPSAPLEPDVLVADQPPAVTTPLTWQQRQQRARLIRLEHLPK